MLVGADGGIARARPDRRSATWPPARSPATTRSHRSAPRAVDQVAIVDGYATVADLMVNARYDPELDEVAAFEDQVGSHGGLGGPQTHPFLLYPADLADPPEPIFTSAGVHRVLKSWLAELGQPVVRPWLDDGPDPTTAPAVNAPPES